MENASNLSIKFFCDNCGKETIETELNKLKMAMHAFENRLMFEDKFDLCASCAETAPTALRKFIGQGLEKEKELE